jgi:hypothetical protein
MTFWDAVWAKLKSWGQWAAMHMLAPGVALLVVIGAVLLVMFGVKGLQIGGLLGKLLGKKPETSDPIAVANSIPEERVDAQGKLIPVGVPDSKGFVQAPVVAIEPPGLFSNPDTIKFTPPGESKAVEVKLPTGVRANDVEKVVIVQPEKFVVTVKDSSRVSAEQIDDLLAKYGQ